MIRLLIIVMTILGSWSSLHAQSSPQQKKPAQNRRTASSPETSQPSRKTRTQEGVERDDDDAEADINGPERPAPSAPGSSGRYAPSGPNPSESIAVVEKRPQGSNWVIKFQLKSYPQTQDEQEKQRLLDALAVKISNTLDDYSKWYGPLASQEVRLQEVLDIMNPPLPEAGKLVFQKEALTPDKLSRTLPVQLATLWFGQKLQGESWIMAGLAQYSQYLEIESHNPAAAQSDLSEMQSFASILVDTEQNGSEKKKENTPDQFRLVDLDSIDQQDIHYKAILSRAAITFDKVRKIVGDKVFFGVLHALAVNPGGDPITTDRLVQLVKTAGGADLSTFFGDWTSSSYVPKFQIKATVFQLPDDTFSTEGTLKSDELFKGQVILNVEYADGTKEPKIQPVAGKETTFTFPSKASPVSVKPDTVWGSSQNNKDSVFRGRIYAAEYYLERYHKIHDRTDWNYAWKALNEALELKENSSLAKFHAGQLYFILEKPDYKSAQANFDAALNVDGIPQWTLAWSHLYLGIILDLRDQRPQAVEHYKKAVELAVDPEVKALAEQYLSKDKEKQYKREPYPAPVTGKPIISLKK